MTSEDGDSVVASPHLFRLDDEDDEYEDLLGTQFSNDNPDLPLLDLDEDFTPRAAEPSTQPLRRRRPRVNIPANAEIIDLDGFETGRGPLNLPKAFIKAEDQDVVLLSVEKPATVKTEEPDFSWKVMPEQYINLVDPDEEAQDGKILSAIKQESEEEWTWTEMPREVIQLSDSEDETTKEPPKITSADRSNQVELPDQAALSQPIPASALSESMLRSNIKDKMAKRNPIDRERLLQIQKLYAERALGRAVIVGAGGIFKGSQGSAANIPEDELAWMNSTVDPNEDADAAKEFAETKARYNRKKRAGRNSFEEDVLFMKAESAEKARLKRLDDDYHRARGPVYEYVP